jgi:hypothetical protein
MGKLTLGRLRRQTTGPNGDVLPGCAGETAVMLAGFPMLPSAGNRHHHAHDRECLPDTSAAPNRRLDPCYFGVGCARIEGVGRSMVVVET